jgi:hypothetical protein
MTGRGRATTTRIRRAIVVVVAGKPSPSFAIKLTLENIPLMEYSVQMAWDVEHTDEFAEWYHGLSEAQQERMVPIADQLYDLYIAEIRNEGLIP